MTGNSFLQLSFYLVVLVRCVKPLGRYMADVLEGTRPCLFGPMERWLYRVARVDPSAGMPDFPLKVALAGNPNNLRRLSAFSNLGLGRRESV